MRAITVGVLIFFLNVLTISAQDITLVTYGEGGTKREAVEAALRSALEQSYKTFVSANTDILNDEITKDGVSTVTSGNIKSYKELSNIHDASGYFTATVQSTVSIGRLIEFAKSHGSSAEFGGQTFAMNMKMREFNKKNEREVLDNLLKQLKSFMPDIFEGSIIIDEPKKTGNIYMVPIKLTISTTQNFIEFYDLLFNTLASLSLNENELQDYIKNDFEYTTVLNEINPIELAGSKKSNFLYLRSNKQDIEKFFKTISGMLQDSYKIINVKELSGKKRIVSPSFNNLRFVATYDNLFKIGKTNYSFGPIKISYNEDFDREFLRPEILPREKNYKLNTSYINFFYDNIEEMSAITGFEVTTENLTNKNTKLNDFKNYLKEKNIPYWIEDDIVIIPLEEGKQCGIDFEGNHILADNFVSPLGSINYGYGIIYPKDRINNATFPQLIKVTLGKRYLIIEYQENNIYFSRNLNYKR